MKRVLLVGAGGWAREHWIEKVWPDFRDRVVISGLVDKNETVLHDSGECLGVPRELRFTLMDKAFEKVSADFCVISIPPAYHKHAVLLAADKGMHILSEKPIADTFEDVAAIYKTVKERSLKMAITQNYRFEAPILTLRDVLRSGKLGRLDYIVAKYSSDYRKPRSWGVDNVHERENPLLIEAAIHHFDMIRNLTNSNCETIIGYGWNPAWSSFRGNPNGLFLMQMEDGIKAIYEGNSLESGITNNWFHEYYRVQCEKGVASVGRDQVVRIYRRGNSGHQIIEEVPLVDVQLRGHHAILSEFLHWLDGEKPVETELQDNIYSAAMVFAAIASVNDGEVKNALDYLP